MRAGIEKLTPHVRYVYVPGGGDRFIPKEDIAIALDEEVTWLERFVDAEAKAAGVPPWAYFEVVNTHYWDGGVIAVKLIERWKNKAALDFLRRAVDGAFVPIIDRITVDRAHKLCLAREIYLHLGELAIRASGTSDPMATILRLTGGGLDKKAGFQPHERDKKEFLDTIRLGEALTKLLRVDDMSLHQALERVDTHVWTPHSLGIIKERNYWEKDVERF